MSSGIWIRTGFLPEWLLRRCGAGASAVRRVLGVDADRAGARADVGSEDGTDAGASGSSSKMLASADGFLAITPPRLLA
ncbi:hypothetical protein SPHINGO391_110029 [Sphingomonas aurantiaca]|uniref:Uncharacterized protein n=1 Tax=Sphingomonas aurantiaca TaxID=185949 RepID=A0A5E7XW00_9SPHN|nr:hypothetical protein SPHINGO391_110029 [Sphingomonas aurantiaca]